MAGKLKITFKRHPKETGLRGVGNGTPSVDIKLNGKNFGLLAAPSWQQGGWRIGIQVVKTETVTDNNPNCEWKWVYFKYNPSTEEEARAWVLSHIDSLALVYTFHTHED